MVAMQKLSASTARKSDVIALAGDADWLIAFTKPRQESQAQQQLQQQHFETYLPLFRKIRRTAQGVVNVHEPMFPRYLMFRPTREGQSISVVRSTRGVTSLVRFGHEPARLRHDLVEAIRDHQRQREQAGLEELSQLRTGQKVRLRHTALDGLEGLVQQVSSKRVAVLLDILGRPAALQLEHHQVEPVP
jgi:transcriptional antiterminator RfaH